MKKINDFKILKLRSFKDQRGTLIPISFKNNFSRVIKRIFYIHGNKNFFRGDHAHKKCLQIFIPIIGKMTVYVKKKNLKKIKISQKKPVAIILAPLTWSKIKFNQNNSTLMVLCSHEYDFKDYIETYDEFKKYIKSK